MIDVNHSILCSGRSDYPSEIRLYVRTNNFKTCQQIFDLLVERDFQNRNLKAKSALVGCGLMAGHAS